MAACDAQRDPDGDADPDILEECLSQNCAKTGANRYSHGDTHAAQNSVSRWRDFGVLPLSTDLR
jgi:hypothetical protein